MSDVVRNGVCAELELSECVDIITSSEHPDGTAGEALLQGQHDNVTKPQ